MRSVVSYGRRSSLFLLLISFLLFSCVGVRKFKEDTYAARNKDKKAFVEMADGTITEGNEAVVRTPFLGKSTIELDKTTKIPMKEVTAYQDKQGYYRRIDGQFAPRIKAGLINMYLTTETYTQYEAPTMGRSTGSFRTRQRTVYYLQKGGDQAAVGKFSPSLTRSYVQDYQPAMEFMNVYDQNNKKAKIWSIVNTAAVAGGALLMIAGGTSQDGTKVTGTGYTGAGLFFGGLVSGLTNKVRKAKNVKNLELAIDEYNFQTRRKRK